MAAARSPSARALVAVPCRSRRLAGVAGTLLALSANVAGAQEPAVEPLLAELEREGPLDNDSFLILAPGANEACEEGDALLAGESASAERWTQAFESWRRALAESTAGAMVSPLPPFRPDAGGTAERSASGVWVAVERRLRLLGPRARRLWREHFAELGAVELAAARNDPRALAAVERRNPHTPAAARAALGCADWALAEGRLEAARGWLERAERHAGGTAGDPGEASSVPARVFAARRAVLDELATARAAPGPDVDWRDVPGLELLNILRVDDAGVHGRADLPAADRGVRPGAVALGEGRAAVQYASQVHLIELDTGIRELFFEPAKLGAGVAPEQVVAPRGAPGWPLQPLWDGTALVLVQGTGTAERGNALMAIEPPGRDTALAAPALVGAGRPRLRCGRPAAAGARPGGARGLRVPTRSVDRRRDRRLPNLATASQPRRPLGRAALRERR